MPAWVPHEKLIIAKIANEQGLFTYINILAKIQTDHELTINQVGAVA